MHCIDNVNPCTPECRYVLTGGEYAPVMLRWLVRPEICAYQGL